MDQAHRRQAGPLLASLLIRVSQTLHEGRTAYDYVRTLDLPARATWGPVAGGAGRLGGTAGVQNA